jgi:hypothetical protein
VQFTCALTAARIWQAIFASTPQVALHEAEHLLAQLSCAPDAQFEAHASSHCALH